MYGEILKYGSYIVDGLVEYKRPVFVYIPPFGELRGGAWVVVDSKINPEVMEMFADKDSRFVTPFFIPLSLKGTRYNHIVHYTPLTYPSTSCHTSQGLLLNMAIQIARFYQGYYASWLIFNIACILTTDLSNPIN